MGAGAAVAEAADSPARAEARASEIAGIVNAARYLAPVVLDLPADGSAAGIATAADHVAVVAPATAEPPLVDAVAAVIGGHPLKVVNRLGDPATWASRVDIQLPDARIAARAAAMGVRPLGPLGAAIAELADALEVPR